VGDDRSGAWEIGDQCDFPEKISLKQTFDRECYAPPTQTEPPENHVYRVARIALLKTTCLIEIFKGPAIAQKLDRFLRQAAKHCDEAKTDSPKWHCGKSSRSRMTWELFCHLPHEGTGP